MLTSFSPYIVLRCYSEPLYLISSDIELLNNSFVNPYLGTSPSKVITYHIIIFPFANQIDLSHLSILYYPC